jgi:hypothetical protein
MSTTRGQRVNRNSSSGIENPISRSIGCHRTHARAFGLRLAVFAALAAVAGCSDDDNPFNVVGEDELAPPLGLSSITGDEEVALTWFTSNFEDDFEGYIVFMAEGEFGSDQSTELPTAFAPVDTLEFSSSGTPRNLTISGLDNDSTYSFAVVSWNGDDDVSRASNIVEDTPRPEISSVTLTSASTNDVTGNDATAGFDFDDFTPKSVPLDINGADYMNANGADIVHEAFDPSPENDNIRSWLAGMNNGGVQDLGYMASLDSANVAPPVGYAGNGESVLLTVGHVYAIKTGENRFGKIIVTAIQPGQNATVTFNAAFQDDTGNRNYKQGESWRWALGIAKSPR